MKQKNLLNIFMVDDDAFCLALFKQQLLGAGYSKIKVFLHANECFDHIAVETPDVILLDYEMEPHNGLDMLFCLKKQYPSIKVIILSGHENGKNVDSARLFGADNYVVKGGKALRDIEKILEGVCDEKKLSEVLL